SSAAVGSAGDGAARGIPRDAGGRAVPRGGGTNRRGVARRLPAGHPQRAPRRGAHRADARLHPAHARAGRQPARRVRPQAGDDSRRGGEGVSGAPDAHQAAMEGAAEPPFIEELAAVWGDSFGAHDEVGVLRSVMVRPPGDELKAIREDAWDEDLGALVDPEGHWYWTDRRPPDLDLVAAQHAGLVEALRAEGVDVVVAEPLGP